MTIDLNVVKEIIVGIAGVTTAITIIWAFVKNHMDSIIGKITEPIIDKIDSLDKSQCMNWLVEFLADVKNGVPKSDYQIARAHEVYRHYSVDLKGNSYIHEQWERIMKGD